MKRLSTDGAWRTYGVADGLPGLKAEHVTEDAEGYLWVATWAGGVGRFDGDRFETFTVDDGLPDNRVMHILRDRQDRLWFGTGCGLCWWDEGAFHRPPPADGFPAQRVQFLAESRDGRLLVAGNRLLGYCDGSGYHDLIPDLLAQAPAPAVDTWSSQTWGITEDGDGGIWFGCAKDSPLSGLMRYDGERFERFGEAHGLETPSSAYAVCVDTAGDIWVGGDARIWRYRDGAFEPQPVDFATSVRKIQCDRDGRVWFGTTADGVLCHDGSRFHHLTVDDGLPCEMVNGVHQDREGLFWFATYGGGLACYDPLGVHVVDGGGRMPASTAVVEDRQGHIWVQWGDLAVERTARYDGEALDVYGSLPGMALCYAIYRDPADRLLFGGGGLVQHDGAAFRSLPSFPDLTGLTISALGADDEGRLLLGVFHGSAIPQRSRPGPLAIARLDGSHLEPLWKLDAPPPRAVRSIVPASGGGFWFGVSGYGFAEGEGCGLGRWYPDGSVRFYTTADGLAADDVSGLAEDRQGILWVTTSAGVSRFDGTAFRSFGTGDGLPSWHVHCVCVDRDGQLWFGTESGVARYDGAIFQQVRDPRISATHDIIQDRHGQYWFATQSGTVRYRPAATPPRVRVQRILADRPYAPDDPIRFSTSIRQVLFEYSGLGFRTRPQDMLYRTRLEGHQEEWSPSQRERRALFHDLGPGRYTFQVQAIDRDLNRSDPVGVAFEVVRSQRDERIDELERQRQRLKGQLALIAEREATHWGIEGFVGRSETIRAILQDVRLLQETGRTSVLITGESGTGKELIARAVHAGGPRCDGPFVPVNCAAIPGELGESLLFGHVRGAFTGAVGDRPGYFEMADGGTLFLDEIGDMSLDMQAKLLRVLEDGEVWRVGDRRGRRVDVRLLAATHANLRQRIAEDRFRQDLFYRISAYTVAVPSLRERRSDIPVLVQHFLRLFADEMGVDEPVLAEAARRLLQTHGFAGNVRELKNVIERAVLESRGGLIEPRHLHLAEAVTPTTTGADTQAGTPPAPSHVSESLPASLDDGVAEAQLRIVEDAVHAAGGNVSEAARLLGTSRTRLYRILRRREGPATPRSQRPPASTQE